MRVYDKRKDGLLREPYLLTNIQVLEWIEQTKMRSAKVQSSSTEVNDVLKDRVQSFDLLEQVKLYLTCPNTPLDTTNIQNVKMRNCKATINGLSRVLKAKPYSLPKKYILQIFNLRPSNTAALGAILEGMDYPEELAQEILQHIRTYLGPVTDLREAEAFKLAQDEIAEKPASSKRIPQGT